MGSILMLILVAFSFSSFFIKPITIHQIEDQFTIILKFNDYRQMVYMYNKLSKMTKFKFQVITDYKAECILLELKTQREVDNMVAILNKKIQQHYANGFRYD